jgi:hypothetical protein
MEPMSADERIAYTCIMLGLFYFFDVWLLGASFGKSTVIGLAIVMAALIDMGRRWLMRGGLVLTVLAFGVWLSVLPEPAQWTDFFHQSFNDIFAKFASR